MAALALIIGLSWKGSINLLFQLNEPFSMQLFPAFMLGLLSPTLFHPWSMASGAMAGMLATIILEVIMTQDQDLADYAVSFVFIVCTTSWYMIRFVLTFSSSFYENSFAQVSVHFVSTVWWSL